MMQRLNLDLVKSPTPAWPGMLILLVALVCAWLSYWQYTGISERNQKTQRELAQLNVASQKVHAANQSTLSSAELEAADKRAREVTSALLLPWSELFAALESASSNDVAVLAIEPDQKKRMVRITAEVKDFDKLVDYLKRLGKAPQLRFVRLQRYEVREGDPQHPLQFTVEASWRMPS
jgi:Tfp pilus assembly protein PilN